MQVVFKTKKLKMCFLKSARGAREWGPKIARKYILRVGILQQAKSLSDLCALSGLRCHPLKGGRAGQYAVNLDGAWRLVFSMEGDRAQVIRIEEVSNHYDD